LAAFSINYLDLAVLWPPSTSIKEDFPA